MKKNEVKPSLVLLSMLELIYQHLEPHSSEYSLELLDSSYLYNKILGIPSYTILRQDEDGQGRKAVLLNSRSNLAHSISFDSYSYQVCKPEFDLLSSMFNSGFSRLS